MGDDGSSYGHRERLHAELNRLKDVLSKSLYEYSQSVQSYSDSMLNALSKISNNSHCEFMQLHQNSKSAAVDQVCSSDDS